MSRRSLSALVCLGLVAAGVPAEATGQVRFNDGRRGARFLFEGTVGYSFLTGELGDSISGGFGGEVGAQYQLREAPLRLGLGGGYANLSYSELDGTADKWSFYGLASYLIYSNESEMIPYVQARVGWTRLSDDLDGAGRSRAGLEIGALVGVDIPVGEKISLEAVGAFSWITTGEASIRGVNVPGSSQAGSSFGLRAGALFFLD